MWVKKIRGKIHYFGKWVKRVDGVLNAFITYTKLERTEKGGMRKDLIGIQFTKLLIALNIRREGVGFYSLRQDFETITGRSKDRVAVDLIVGHTDPPMAAVYREEVEDAHLRAEGGRGLMCSATT